MTIRNSSYERQLRSLDKFNNIVPPAPLKVKEIHRPGVLPSPLHTKPDNINNIDMEKQPNFHKVSTDKLVILF